MLVNNCGGRGASFRAKGEKRSLTFAKGIGSPSEKLHPAYMNRIKNTGNEDRIIQDFNKKHTKANREYAIQIDENGYVTNYYKGKRGSVSYSTEETKDKHLVHNHPSAGWGNFSGTDLETWASTGQRAVTASSRNSTPISNVAPKVYANRRAGTYTIRKKSHFKRDEFIKAIKNLKVESKNYDRSLGKWLKNNASTFGYEYTYKPAKNKI